MASDSVTPRSHILLLVLLTLANVALRWTGLDYGLPHVTQNDELVYYSQYRAIVEHDPHPETRRRFPAYPPTWTYIAASLPRFEDPPRPPGIERELGQTSADYLFLRRWVAVLSSLIVPTTWLLARRFVGSGWALVAGALAGASVLDFCLSTQARPHGIAAAMIPLAVAAAVEVARAGTWRASAFAGVAAGLAIGTLQSGAGALLSLAVAYAWRLRRDGRRALLQLGLAVVAGLPIFLFAYPAILAKLRAEHFAAGDRHGFLASHGVVWEDFHGGGLDNVLQGFWYYDPLLFGVAGATVVAGAVVAVRRRALRVALAPEMGAVLAFCVPYLVALCLFERTFHRFTLPLVPFAALFAVIGSRALGRASAIAGGALLLFQHACVAQIVRLHCAGDTAQQAAAWIRATLDRRSARIALSPWLDLPLVRKRAALSEHGLVEADEWQPWLNHQRAMDATALDEAGFWIVDLPLRRAAQREALLADPVGFIRALDADYLLIDVFAGTERPLMTTVRDGARETGELVARFTPQGPDEDSPQLIDPYVESDHFRSQRFVWQMWGARSLGSGLEIYRIRR